MAHMGAEAESEPGDSYQPRMTPLFRPRRRERSRGRRWFIAAAIAAVLLGIGMGAWAAVSAVQRDLQDPPASGSSLAIPALSMPTA